MRSYEEPVMEVITMDAADVICTSGSDSGSGGVPVFNCQCGGEAF